MSNVSKLQSCINKAKDEAGSIPQLISQDAEENLTAADKDIYQAEEVKEESVTLKAEADDSEEIENTEEINSEEPEVADAEDSDAENIEDHLETDLADAEEETKDINENIVVFLYRAFAEIGDNVKMFIEDEENEERDADLVQVLSELKEGLPEVMDVVKELAKTYVHSVELFDPEEEEVLDGDDEENLEEPENVDSIEDADLEDDLEDEAAVESYLKESKLEFKKFENEYQVFARYSNSEQAAKFESELSQFKGAEVFNYTEIGEVHAFINVK